MWNDLAGAAKSFASMDGGKKYWEGCESRMRNMGTVGSHLLDIIRGGTVLELKEGE